MSTKEINARLMEGLTTWQSSSAWLLAATAGAFAASFVAAALCSWPAVALVVPLWALLALIHWLEHRHAADAEAQRRLLQRHLRTLPALVGELRETAYQLEGAVLQACDGFDGIRVQARAAKGDENLEGEILRVVIALQFQDIVNQRIGHAIDALSSLGADLAACLKGAPEAEAMTQGLHRVASFDAKLPALRGNDRAFKKHAPSSANEANVELFLPEVGP
jgi:hypothetical protein